MVDVMGYKDPEKRREYARKWREENPEKRREYARKWREENPERVREYGRKANRKWREANPEKNREQGRKAGRRLSSRYSQLKCRHKKRWPNDEPISFEEYEAIVSDRCSYCSGALPEAGTGIDRKDSRLGYVPGNCVACCTDCNNHKGRTAHWLYVIVWQALIRRYPHLLHVENPWTDPKIAWMVKRQDK